VKIELARIAGAERVACSEEVVFVRRGSSPGCQQRSAEQQRARNSGKWKLGHRIRQF
jgi:hypothetical protein